MCDYESIYKSKSEDIGEGSTKFQASSDEEALRIAHANAAEAGKELWVLVKYNTEQEKPESYLSGTSVYKHPAYIREFKKSIEESKRLGKM